MINPAYCFLLYSLLMINVQESNPSIVISTDFGNITIELYAQKAPNTVSNFLRYVDAAMLDSSCFYRIVRSDNQPKDSVKIAVIQGGRWQKEDKGFPPITIETTNHTGIKHTSGVISMARSGPNTATSEFFICVGDQPDLDFGGKRNKDGQGFAAFGKVVSGYDIVLKIHNLSAPQQYLEKKVLIHKISRINLKTP
jgi:peptidyl-prolyl cis-trans isomerase A (cyclophilin A)